MADLIAFEREERTLIQMDRTTTITQTWSRAGSLQTPVPGTVSLLTPDGRAVVDAQAFTVAADVASYPVLSTSVDDEPLGEGWQVVWDCAVGAQAARRFVGEAALVRQILAPPATVADLYAREARLDPAHTSPLTRDMDLQAKLDDAWREIEGLLAETGRRPELVMSPTMFRKPHRLFALHLIFEDLVASGNWDAYAIKSDRYLAAFNGAWDEMTFSYDADEDGLVDGGADPKRETSSGVTWISSVDVNGDW